MTQTDCPHMGAGTCDYCLETATTTTTGGTMPTITLTGLWTTDHADVPLAYADRDDRLRERGNLAGTYCDHYNSASYSIIGCDDCWDHAYGPCRFGLCCK